ncbi:MAG: hypothetical protein RIC80_12200 [Cyclobacteriaceae bacterium]
MQVVISKEARLRNLLIFMKMPNYNYFIYITTNPAKQQFTLA